MIFIAILFIVGALIGFVAAKRGINPYVTAGIVGVVGLICSYFIVDVKGQDGRFEPLYALPYFVTALVAALAGYFIAVRSKGDVQ